MSSNSGQAGGACHPDSFVFPESGLVGLTVWRCLGAAMRIGLSAGGVKRWNVAGLGLGFIRTGKSKGWLAGVKWL